MKFLEVLLTAAVTDSKYYDRYLKFEGKEFFFLLDAKCLKFQVDLNFSCLDFLRCDMSSMLHSRDICPTSISKKCHLKLYMLYMIILNNLNSINISSFSILFWGPIKQSVMFFFNRCFHVVQKIIDTNTIWAEMYS